ncbi:UDP-glucose dehydrogenase family protein [Candidatus Margulisiibacteriota bacterium]
MKACVVGIGYVGLVTAACLADSGLQVVCVDKDAGKIEKLKKGKSPIYEPGLSQLLRKSLKKKTITFTHKLNSEALASDVFFVAVGTPPDPFNGRPDLSFINKVAQELSSGLAGLKKRSHKTIVIKSTVPPKTTLRLKKSILNSLKNNKKVTFDVVFNPEFLREGSAIKDTFYPDRIVLGVEGQTAAKALKKLFSSLVKQNDPAFLLTDITSAEMIKYASNAFLATKISFINEIAYLCELAGANIDGVSKGIGMDSRIGQAFLKPGLGYGGSCFPKDTKALDHLAGDHGHSFHLLKAVIDVNNMQKKRFLSKIHKVLGGVENKSIGVLGLAFKQNTDDIRESIAIDLIEALVDQGARVKAHDPLAEANARELFAKRGKQVAFCDSPYDAAKGSHALIIATEWQSFTGLDLVKMSKSMKSPIIFDGRNLLSPQKAKRSGFAYHAVGGHERG